jgi:hypothetical protein
LRYDKIPFAAQNEENRLDIGCTRGYPYDNGPKF